MTVRFIDAGPNQCRAPVEGAGMNMLVCGAQTPPCASYCTECRSRFYYRPTKAEQREVTKTSSIPKPRYR